MKLLAIDTSGPACSAALIRGTERDQLIEVAPRRHGQLILGMMQSLLDSAGLVIRDLDAIAFARGPGSFTGVRIAAAVAQGVAFGADLPVARVSALAALAHGRFRAGGQRRVLTALDARMDEVYWGGFEVEAEGYAEPVCEECACAPERVCVPDGGGWYGIGSGWEAYADRLHARCGTALVGTDPDAVCEALDVALLAVTEARAGRLVPAEQALPVYLRDRVTHRS